MELSIGSYIVANKIRGRRRFPLVTMLEPLAACNLSCQGCGRIREYTPFLDRRMSVEECMHAIESSGAPVVSIAGGEPTIHPQIAEIVAAITASKRYIYLCTNAILLERVLERIPPSKYLCFVVHLDGLESTHDKSVCRNGVFKTAINAMKHAIDEGYRVATNTTVYSTSDTDELVRLFQMLTSMGSEGCMLSPGFQFEMAPDQELFVSRQNANSLFKTILDPKWKISFYNNPLYLDFLRGERSYECMAWANPTYTVAGWREPCYLIADRHIQDFRSLLDDGLWQKYGVGKDPRCANCMMHCGFEPARHSTY